ncbi:unnamed protein product [Caenorhabditis angaria]|uniref:Uncharacterized protein n=1 Tax=Caenorhabditis angaria TaxID=860376 RepID=A0A9P1I990_9PELO|nr:unnamed protein product [Caenorhabditis angaria]
MYSDTDSDTENQGLELLDHNLGLKMPEKSKKEVFSKSHVVKYKYEYEFDATKSFKNSTNFGGFSQENKEENKDLNEFLTSNILFETLSCQENKNSKNICILQLNDLLANLDFSIQTMSREIVKYSKTLDSKNFAELEALGFIDKWNKDVLRKNISSLSISIRLLHSELEDLELLLTNDPPAPKKNFGFSKIFCGVAVIGAAALIWKFVGKS